MSYDGQGNSYGGGSGGGYGGGNYNQGYGQQQQAEEGCAGLPQAILLITGASLSNPGEIVTQLTAQHPLEHGEAYVVFQETPGGDSFAVHVVPAGAFIMTSEDGGGFTSQDGKCHIIPA